MNRSDFWIAWYALLVIGFSIWALMAVGNSNEKAECVTIHQYFDGRHVDGIHCLHVDLVSCANGGEVFVFEDEKDSRLIEEVRVCYE